LGALLYELLTGSTPLDRMRLHSAAFAEVMRMIKEEEPPKPSTRLTQSQESLASLAAQRRTEPAKLTTAVQGELDWIVMKCLEKARTRRYDTANSLARDVERYLHDEPVEACPPTTGYKLRKFARKHRKLLITAAAFAAVLVFGMATSVWQAVRATQAEAVALANEKKANANAVQAQEKEQDANQQRNEAQQQRDLAQRQRDEVRALLYAAHMNLAHRAWEEASVYRAMGLLGQHRPKPGETDIRGFEWYYLDRLCRSSR
jgi:hypothetical protein